MHNTSFEASGLLGVLYAVLIRFQILKSLVELRTKRKRPDHASVVSYAEKYHGLSIEEGRQRPLMW